MALFRDGPLSLKATSMQISVTTLVTPVDRCAIISGKKRDVDMFGSRRVSDRIRPVPEHQRLIIERYDFQKPSVYRPRRQAGGGAKLVGSIAADGFRKFCEKSKGMGLKH
jgi:hypothetical protein